MGCADQLDKDFLDAAFLSRKEMSVVKKGKGRMSVDVELPPNEADKWSRLLGAYDNDAETLAIAAIDLLWDKYGDSVVNAERLRERLDGSIRETGKRIRSSRSDRIARSVVFVGAKDCPLGEDWTIGLPEDWASPFVASGAAFLYVDPQTQGIGVIPAQDVCDADLPNGKMCCVRKTGKITIPVTMRSGLTSGGMIRIRGCLSRLMITHFTKKKP